MGEWAYHTLSEVANRVRPLPGFLWCQEVLRSVDRYIPGLGTVSVASETPGGLYLPPEDKQSSPLAGKLLIVRHKGGEPSQGWTQRWYGRERDWDTSFEQQKIHEGTLLVVRKVAGLSAIECSDWYQVRHDEVCAIGIPYGEEHESGLDMLPAPGWVAVQLDQLPEATVDGLWVRAEVRAVVQDYGGVWGTVSALHRGADPENSPLKRGDRVLLPAHTGSGATEYIEHQGLRYCPEDDILAVQESP